MDDSPLTKEMENQFLNIFDNHKNDLDIIIIADYGHGLISDKVIDFVSCSKAFLALNAQSNAGNRGHNSISRYKRGDFITFNGAESKLEMKRKNLGESQFIDEIYSQLNAKSILITKGSEGIELFTIDSGSVKAPAFAPFVKDRVGAGDALLSVTSLLLAVGAPPEIVSFYANVVGAWSVTFVGNSKTLNRGELIKQIKSILK